MPSNISGAPTKVGFRCASCGEYTVRDLDWSREHDNLPCQACGGLIDLSTDGNRDLIARALQGRARSDT